MNRSARYGCNYSRIESFLHACLFKKDLATLKSKYS